MKLAGSKCITKEAKEVKGSKSWTQSSDFGYGKHDEVEGEKLLFEGL